MIKSAYNQGKHRFKKHNIQVSLYYANHRNILKLQQHKTETHPHKVAGWPQLKHGTNSCPWEACILLQLMMLCLQQQHTLLLWQKSPNSASDRLPADNTFWQWRRTLDTGNKVTTRLEYNSTFFHVANLADSCIINFFLFGIIFLWHRLRAATQNGQCESWSYSTQQNKLLYPFKEKK